MLLENSLPKEIGLFLSSIPSKMSRESKTAENNDVSTPITSVVAKPCTGPEPKI